MSALLTNTNQPSLRHWIENLREFELDNFFETRVLGRGYAYISKLDFISEQENKISASVSGQNNYMTEITFRDGDVFSTCSCPFKGHCKHMAALILHIMNKK